MLDAAARRVLDRPLARTAGVLDRSWVSPDRLTAVGLVLGLGSAAAAAVTLWWPALVLWLLSRLADGLDGPLARRRRAAGAPGDAGAGGFFDITADFLVYGAGVLGVALGVTAGRGDPWEPFAAVLLAYYVNGAAFLAFSSLAERAGRQLDDSRSLSFLGGLAEGTETIVVHALWLLLPAFAWQLAWVWAVVVGISAVHRMWAGHRALR
ncbi:CDP-alcohol phosphatidyltransferase family protein [Modestobacter sp. VKM Ac-2984]|uniref:CDP-alcohol phosphatidyltransferase family protein n=1 Tax=Modestobacter sp. VKM Ac-2984 TaxID=3004138 RepID=UPI0022AB3E3A|nr:CDP-alcohol phosphatidyltransferase family protein [Modestobacter sp. VKM Ac-2984]MCZ2815660.1 CDP-alcohol phosphatidyltransferase family protein [Modestobacter sp. VKM Ac-2984]